MAAGLNIALIHSPLLGPMTWAPAAESLRRLGHERVETPRACAWDERAPYYAGLATRIVEQLAPEAGERWVLVGHSAAGGLMTEVGEAPGLQVEAAIFVDAILPHPRQCWFDTAPPALRSNVMPLARDGRLPPWPAWFPPQVLATLAPDTGMRAAFRAECEAIPYAYLVEPAPIAPNWPPPAVGYLQLSASYQAEADAAARSWVVEREPLDHLAPLTAPDKVAASIDRLIKALTRARRDAKP